VRLLIVSTVSSTVKAFLLPFADHFRSLGWQVDALASGIERCDACLAHFDRVYDIEWSRHPLDYRNVTRALLRVRDLVGHGEYDIVHVHTPVAAFITRLALGRRRRATGPSVIYTAHGFHFHPGNSWLRNRVFTALEKIASRRTDYLVTMNRTDEGAALRLGLVPPGRLCFMPGIGVDRHRFRPSAVPPAELEALRRLLGIGDDNPVFTMIAEFIPRKRHRDVVAALSRLQHENVHVVFVGDGPLRKPIGRLVANSGLAGRVHFAGLQADVRSFILMSRATILPSTQEGLPRSVLESLSCGVPVIGSDIRGTQDLLGDGGGMLYPAGDIGALASLIEWFTDHPEKVAAMGGRAVACMDQYDTARIVSLHEELYASAMNLRVPPAEAIVPRRNN